MFRVTPARLEQMTQRRYAGVDRVQEPESGELLERQGRMLTRTECEGMTTVLQYA